MKLVPPHPVPLPGGERGVRAIPLEFIPMESGEGMAIIVSGL